MSDHKHDWRGHEKDLSKASCTVAGCHTIVAIGDLIDNARSQGAHAAKLRLLVKQLRTKVLRKSAHDAALAWVRTHNPDALPVSDEQGMLLP